MINPITEENLGEIAQFLVDWHLQRRLEGREPSPEKVDPLRVQQKLRWLLIENPARVDSEPLGAYLRGQDGRVVGMLLFFAEQFLLGDQRLSGLSSGSFFVLPSARIQGFFLLRRYMNIPGHHFFYATSCNANSSALWQKLRGIPVPGSEAEYLFPVNVHRVASAFARSKNLSSLAVRITGVGAALLKPLFRFAGRRRSRLHLEPSRDWDLLAALSERHRPKSLLTASRSARYLEWRFGRTSSFSRSETYVFRTPGGREGWVALEKTLRGRLRDLDTVAIADMVWPRESLDIQEPLTAVIDAVRSRCDLVLFSPTATVPGKLSRLGFMRNKLESPCSFVRAATPDLDSASLSRIADFALADGDALV